MWEQWIDPDDARVNRDLWCRYGVKGPRTNNHLEGWHLSMKTKIRIHHPNLYVFIDAIKKEQKVQSVRLGQAEDGGQVNFVRQKVVRCDEKIKKRIAQYTSGERTALDFLDKVGKHLKLKE
jgi:hypothetical protein